MHSRVHIIYLLFTCAISVPTWYSVFTVSTQSFVVSIDSMTDSEESTSTHLVLDLVKRSVWLFRLIDDGEACDSCSVVYRYKVFTWACQLLPFRDWWLHLASCHVGLPNSRGIFVMSWCHHPRLNYTNRSMYIVVTFEAVDKRVIWFKMLWLYVCSVKWMSLIVLWDLAWEWTAS